MKIMPLLRLLLSRLTLACLATAALVGTSPAEDALDVPPPREPLLPRMPVNSEWTIKLTSNNDDSARLSLADPKKNAEPAKSDRYLDSVTITKLGPATYRETSQWFNRSAPIEKWIVDGLSIQRMPPPINRLIQATSCTSEDFSSYQVSDFQDLEWIGKDNYVGPKVVGGRTVYVFSTENARRRLNQRETLMTDDLFTPLAPLKRSIAYLDAQTQRPLFVDDGTTARVYRYAEAPTGSTAIPDDFAAMFERWKKSLSR
jgi:hypothetical protein